MGPSEIKRHAPRVRAGTRRSNSSNTLCSKGFPESEGVPGKQKFDVHIRITDMVIELRRLRPRSWVLWRGVSARAAGDPFLLRVALEGRSLPVVHDNGFCGVSARAGDPSCLELR